MNAGDRLHQGAVAVFQPLTIERLHAANIRTAVLRQLNAIGIVNQARHTKRPHALISQLSRHMAMNIAQECQHMVDILIYRRDELQQRLCEIGGNPVMLERRSQRIGMTAFSQMTIRLYAQRFAFNAATNTFQGIGMRLQPGERFRYVRDHINLPLGQ